MQQVHLKNLESASAQHVHAKIHWCVTWYWRVCGLGIPDIDCFGVLRLYCKVCIILFPRKGEHAATNHTLNRAKPGANHDTLSTSTFSLDVQTHQKSGACRTGSRFSSPLFWRTHIYSEYETTWSTLRTPSMKCSCDWSRAQCWKCRFLLLMAPTKWCRWTIQNRLGEKKKTGINGVVEWAGKRA